MRSDIVYTNVIDGEEARIAQAAADAAPGLSHEAIDADRFYITQHYHKYTREDHDVWRELFDRRWSILEQQVSGQFIEGMKIIRLSRDRLPLLDDLTLDRDIEVAGGVKITKGGWTGSTSFCRSNRTGRVTACRGIFPPKRFSRAWRSASFRRRW